MARAAAVVPFRPGCGGPSPVSSVSRSRRRDQVSSEGIATVSQPRAQIPVHSRIRLGMSQIRPMSPTSARRAR
jgi:hypothetical protein